jgi:cell division ATPase FtsA
VWSRPVFERTLLSFSQSLRLAQFFLPKKKSWELCLIDIGGGTTDIAVWKEGSLLHSQIIPLGGTSLSRTILAVALEDPS